MEAFMRPNKQELRDPVPQRFPRLNSTTVSLLGKKNLKNSVLLHRALQKLTAAEAAGMNFYSYAKMLDSDS
jgi:hypothetical protein